MLFNVSGLVQEGIGATRHYDVQGSLQTEGRAPERVSGSVELMRTDSGVLVRAHLALADAETCSRRPRPHPGSLRLRQRGHRRALGGPRRAGVARRRRPRRSEREGITRGTTAEETLSEVAARQATQPLGPEAHGPHALPPVPHHAPPAPRLPRLRPLQGPRGCRGPGPERWRVTGRASFLPLRPRMRPGCSRARAPRRSAWGASSTRRRPPPARSSTSPTASLATG